MSLKDYSKVTVLDSTPSQLTPSLNRGPKYHPLPPSPPCPVFESHFRQGKHLSVFSVLWLPKCPISHMAVGGAYWGSHDWSLMKTSLKFSCSESQAISSLLIWPITPFKDSWVLSASLSNLLQFVLVLILLWKHQSKKLLRVDHKN